MQTHNRTELSWLRPFSWPAGQTDRQTDIRPVTPVLLRIALNVQPFSVFVISPSGFGHSGAGATCFMSLFSAVWAGFGFVAEVPLLLQ